MKNIRLPNSNEWQKIVDDAFSSDEIHTFSENYNMKKHSMQSMRKGITMKKNNLVMNLTVAAAALTVIAVPTTLFIGSKLSESKVATQIETVSDDESAIVEETSEEYIEQVADTEVTITDGEDDGQVNEEIHQFTEDDIDYDTIYN
ncbi:MAG: hypothetical protein K2I06_10280, partial [Ruminococcus sp.]|nr:hypothetical protein [Ruminococcus sp.]